MGRISAPVAPAAGARNSSSDNNTRDANAEAEAAEGITGSSETSPEGVLRLRRTSLPARFTTRDDSNIYPVRSDGRTRRYLNAITLTPTATRPRLPRAPPSSRREDGRGPGGTYLARNRDMPACLSRWRVRGWSRVDVCARPPRRRPFEPHARTRRVLSRFESRAVGCRGGARDGDVPGGDGGVFARRRRGRRRRRRSPWTTLRLRAATRDGCGRANRRGGRAASGDCGFAGGRGTGLAGATRSDGSEGLSGSFATEVVMSRRTRHARGPVGDRVPPWRARRRRSSTRDRIDRGCTPRRDRDAHIVVAVGSMVSCRRHRARGRARLRRCDATYRQRQGALL